MVSRQLLACISDSISKRPSISLSEISSKHLDQLTDDTLNPLLGPRPQGGNASERRRLFPCARAFNLNSCPRITGPAVLTLLRHLPKLLRLSITGSKRLFGKRADIDVSVPHQATYWNPALLLESLDISRCVINSMGLLSLSSFMLWDIQAANGATPFLRIALSRVLLPSS